MTLPESAAATPPRGPSETGELTTVMKRKQRRTIRGLDILQSVYAVFMGLGLKDVFASGYEYVAKSPPFDIADLRGTAGANRITAVLLALNVLLVGIRFF